MDIAAAASSDYPSSVDVRADVELPAHPQMAFQCRCGKMIAGGSKSFRQHLHQSSKCRGARQPCAYWGKSVAVQAGSLAQHLTFCKASKGRGNKIVCPLPQAQRQNESHVRISDCPLRAEQRQVHMLPTALRFVQR